MPLRGDSWASWSGTGHDAKGAEGERGLAPNRQTPLYGNGIRRGVRGAAGGAADANRAVEDCRPAELVVVVVVDVVVVVVVVGAVVVVVDTAVVVVVGGVVVGGAVVVVVGAPVVVVVLSHTNEPPAEPAPQESQQLAVVPSHAWPPFGGLHWLDCDLIEHFTLPRESTRQQVTAPGLPPVEFAA